MRRTALAFTATALLAAACAAPASKDLGSLSKSSTIASGRTTQVHVQPAAPADVDFTDLGQRLNSPAGLTKPWSGPVGPASPAPRASGTQPAPASPPPADPCNRPAPAGRPGIMLPACSSG